MRVALRDPDSNRLLENWQWLINDGEVLYVTLLSDLIIERQDGFWFPVVYRKQVMNRQLAIAERLSLGTRN